MKRDEPFDSSIKSRTVPDGLVFRLAHRRDCDSINALTAERNPSQNIADIAAGTNREMDRIEAGESYKLYVAELKGEVVGFCRFAHSDGLPANKKIYPAPEGWYGLGILVAPKFRRQNIANFLSSKRTEILKDLRAKEFYSVVDSSNQTSMKMHQNFGYVEIGRAPGFLHIGFNGGIGCLFKLSI
jgi:ribosomal protein S18 acetylase RimI-like enzyme